MKRKTETQLKKIAKVLYFDVNPKLKVIYADELGRFSENKDNLLQINKGKDIKVVGISKEAVAKTSTSGIVNYSENPEEFPGAVVKKANEKKGDLKALKDATKTIEALAENNQKLEEDFEIKLAAKQAELDEALAKNETK